MTYYFDQMHERLRKAKESWRAYVTAADAHQPGEPYPAYYDYYPVVEAIEQKLMLDCQLVAQLPGFPQDLVDEMQLIIARRSTEPLCYAPADDEDEAATFQRLHSFVWDMHTLFHEVGRRGLGFTDKPDSMLAWHAGTLEDRRLALMRERPEFAAAVAKYDAGVARTLAELEAP